MKIWFFPFLLVSTMITGAASAKLQELTDAELAGVHGTIDIGNAILGILTAKIQSGQHMTAEELLKSLSLVAQAFGVGLEGLVVSGTQYGNFHVNLSRGPNLLGQVQLPSAIEAIHIGAIRLGGGQSIGSLTIENIQISGQMKITIH